jgi:hypothetical protein
MIVLAVIIAVLLLICFVRLGAVVEYGEEGITAVASVGPLRIRLLPRGVKRKTEKKKKGKEQAAGAAVKAGRLESLKNQLPSLNRALARLKRRLLINELTIHYMAAVTDPAQTALYFGGASAGYGIILPLLENNFRIKKRDLRAAVNFEATEPYIFIRAKLTLAVWEAIYVGFGLVKNILKSESMRAKLRKAV